MSIKDEKFKEFIRTSDPIWILDNKDWKKGILISKDEIGYLVESKSVRFYAQTILIRNEENIDCQSNLIDIPHLNEPSILNAVNMRFNKNIIYTYTGKILISVNPFKEFDLYSEDTMNMYKTLSVVNPHIYQIANNTFNNFHTNQTILVSGESGAGKTHATRSLMKYFAYISSKNNTSHIEDKVIQSNPILEAFGNAKTMRNDNSSRFGKFIKLQFNNSNVLLGSQIDTYLLEKIRVVRQSSKERNFHIFYQLLSNELKYKYFLKDATDYKYLNYKFIYRDDLVEDSDEFLLTLSAMRTMGFSEIEIDIIFSIISSILHIGNIKFEDGQIINTQQTIDNIIKLLNIDTELLASSLLHRYLDVQGEVYKIDLTSEEVERAKNSLSMKLYQDLFSYIVEKINLNLNSGGNKFIGILDIFGFESFEINRFEQLCINYTNETLQQQFNKYIFKLEQIEYEKEGIDWTHIDFPDNQECLNLIAGKIGLIELLDEECKIPKGSSINFTTKFIRTYKDNKNLVINKKYMTNKFSIIHYAGSVEYDTSYFYEKNNDRISNEISNLLNKIKLNFKSKTKKKTVMVQFRNSLTQLMKIINKTSPHYIRCIKPNDLNKPGIFNRVRVNDQLKYSGILEAVKVARAGYPIRFKMDLFESKYFMIPNHFSLLEKENFCIGKTKIFLKMPGYEKLEKIKKEVLTNKVIILQAQFRMFLIKKYYLDIRKKIINLQSFNRIIIAKKRYLFIKKLNSSITIQKYIRTFLQKKRYQIVYQKIKFIQNYYRKFKNKIETQYSIIIQKQYRLYITRKRYLIILAKVRLIQTNIRKYLKYQSKIKHKNKKLLNELKNLEVKHIKETYILQQNLFELKNKAKKAVLERKNTETEIKFLEDGMKRSINEKMILSRRLEDLMIENDRIRNMKRASVVDNCIVM